MKESRSAPNSQSLYFRPNSILCDKVLEMFCGMCCGPFLREQPLLSDIGSSQPVDLVAVPQPWARPLAAAGGLQAEVPGVVPLDMQIPAFAAATPTSDDKSQTPPAVVPLTVATSSPTAARVVPPAAPSSTGVVPPAAPSLTGVVPPASSPAVAFARIADADASAR